MNTWSRSQFQLEMALTRNYLSRSRVTSAATYIGQTGNVRVLFARTATFAQLFARVLTMRNVLSINELASEKPIEQNRVFSPWDPVFLAAGGAALGRAR